ncbi:hypothetical protein LCGC14_1491140 [marine sediment metagenome]|uniref:Uncharacterized protein n=1 Tax=marine sediment metagenome TaxID=412755 RepID=A0A0F9M8E8_9ZZZZ
MNWENLSREQLLHIVKDILPKAIRKELHATWKEQYRIARIVHPGTVCRRCEDIKLSLYRPTNGN